jgi:hypothetical protein
MTSGKQHSPSIRKAGMGCLRGGLRKSKKKEQYAKIVLTKKKNAAKKVKQTIQECKQMEAETQMKLKAAVEELEQVKTRAKESENNFAMEQRKKDLDISALKDEIDILRTNDQIMTALKTELKMQNKAYVELKEAHDNLKKKLQQYNRNVGQQKRRKKKAINSGRKKGSGERKKNVTMKHKEQVAQVIDKAIAEVIPYSHQQTRAEFLCNVLFDGLIYTKHMAGSIHQRFRKFMRSIYSPWKVMRAIDTGNSVGFNLGCIDTFRSIEQLAFYEQGSICSSQTVKRAGDELEEYAQSNHLSFKEIDTPHGPGIEFDMEQLVRLIVTSYGLTDIAVATGGVELAWTLDGAKITNRAGHICGGFKLVDRRAIDSLTGSPMFLATDANSSVKVQSRDNCFVAKLIFGRETAKAVQECFSSCHDFVKKLEMEGLPARDGLPAFKRFKISSPQDLSSFWKVLDKGGACKQKKLFCHCCMCESKDCASFKVGEGTCDWCKSQGSQKCYHHDMCDNDVLNSYQSYMCEQLGGDLESHYQRVISIKNRSKILSDPNIVEAESNPLHINYQIPVESMARLRFVSLLNEEISLRDTGTMGFAVGGMQLEDKRSFLADLISIEDKVILIKETLKREQESKSMLLLEYCIPCILHMENRVGEKILKTLLNEYLIDLQTERKSVQEASLKALAHFVNRNITGDVVVAGQWEIPLGKDKKTVDEIAMTNSLSRLFVDNMDCLVCELFRTEAKAERKNSWLAMLKEYRAFMELARSREEFSDDDITAFQTQADLFFALWVDLNGIKGITNYIHMIGAGHLTYYLRIYRNLYRYSQQGWEALNQKIKLIFFFHTQRGGNVKVKQGEEKLTRNYIKPIARFLLRDIMWRTGIGASYFTRKYGT